MCKLGCYKLYEDAILPTFGTKQSACFDIYSYLPFNDTIDCYSTQNVKLPIYCCPQDMDAPRYIELIEGMRVLIPTGLIFDIPTGYSVRIHARSGLSLKSGIIVANGEGIIDCDYVDQAYIMLTNRSMERHKIYHGERIAQGELVKSLDYSIEECYTTPSKKSDRTGGFGSTGS